MESFINIDLYYRPMDICMQKGHTGMVDFWIFNFLFIVELAAHMQII